MRSIHPSAVRRSSEDGSAIVEFVLLAVVLLVPLVYLAIAASALQRNLYAVTQAAREAGRGYATGTAADGPDRARYAARLALQDQGLSTAGTEVRYGPADRDCDSADPASWPLTPGAEFAVCVTRSVELPGVPGLLSGGRNTVTGRYVVHADEYRELGPAADSDRRGP